MSIVDIVDRLANEAVTLIPYRLAENYEQGSLHIQLAGQKGELMRNPLSTDWPA
jgi:hypothetical protein